MTPADPNVYQLNYPSISSLADCSASPPADESRRRVAAKMRGEEEAPPSSPQLGSQHQPRYLTDILSGSQPLKHKQIRLLSGPREGKAWPQPKEKQWSSKPTV
ncbi:unnamed protein product [Arctogadus glacialis]